MRLTSAAAGEAAEHTAPASFLSVQLGCSWDLQPPKTPRPGLGVCWGVAAVAEGWLSACMSSFGRLTRGRLLREAPPAPPRERGLSRAVLRRFAASWAWKCGSNTKAEISLMLSISAALSAVIGAGAVRKNVYNAERAKKRMENSLLKATAKSHLAPSSSPPVLFTVINNK